MAFLLFVAFWFLSCESEGPKVTDLRSEVDHGDIISVLEIDRDVARGGPEHSIHATLTIRNDTDKPILITFNSSQQYDFFIEDEDGREHWKWSEDRFFAMVIVEKELGKEPWVYEEDVPMVDREGKPLPSGSYSLRASLVADKKIENRIRFAVK